MPKIPYTPKELLTIAENYGVEIAKEIEKLDAEHQSIFLDGVGAGIKFAVNFIRGK